MIKAPSVIRWTSVDVPVIANLEHEQEICDHISSYGREKYVQFMNLLAKDRTALAKVMSFLEQRHCTMWITRLAPIVAMFSIVFYIVSTYEISAGLRQMMVIVQAAAGAFFVAVLAIRSWLDGFNYLASSTGIIDVITNIPSIFSLLDLFGLDPTVPAIRSEQALVARDLGMMVLLRFIHVQRLVRCISGPTTRQILVVITSVIGIVLVSAGAFQFIEQHYNSHEVDFQDASFLFMNIVTIGQGDVRTFTIVSKLIILMAVAFGFWRVPGEVLTLLRSSQDMSDVTMVSMANASHHVVVLLPPDVTSHEIDEFLGELFHSNHGNSVLTVVILAPARTNVIIRDELKGRTYFRFLYFLTGSPHEDADLQRSNLARSRTVFVLSRRSCTSLENENDEDIHTLLAAVSVKNFCPAVPTIVQINNPQHGSNALWQNLFAFPNIQLLCVKQVKMSLLAGSCVCPGLHVLVSNMLQSFWANVDQQDAWHKEYIHGATNALFPTVFGEYFDGKSFLDASLELYSALGVMPLATCTRSAGGEFMILLNPANHIVRYGDLVYVLARNLNDASMVAIYPNIAMDRAKSKEIVQKLLSNSDLISSFQMRSHSGSLQAEHAGEKRKDTTGGRLHLVEHIVICGYIDMAICELVSTLRKQSLSDAVPIVVIFESPPTKDLVATLSTFPNITLMTGDLQDPAVLQAANLELADHVILLANPFAKKQTDVHEQVVQVDFESVVSLLALETYLHSSGRSGSDTNMLVEILFLSNLRFIRPNFVYTPAAVNELSSNVAQLRLPQLAAADGKVHASGMLQSIAAFSFYNPHIPLIMNAAIYGTVENPESSLTRIVLVKFPEQFVGLTYMKLMEYLVEEFAVLPVGLFRGRSTHRSPVPYVFTNPPAGTIISSDDHVYVVAPISTADDARPVIKHHHRQSNLTADPDLEVVLSIYRQHKQSLSSGIHLFHHALRTTKTGEESDIFEADSAHGWIGRLRIWAQELSSRDWSASATKVHEPHDFREFMQERTHRMATTTVNDPLGQFDDDDDDGGAIHNSSILLKGVNVSAYSKENSVDFLNRAQDDDE